MVTATYLPIKVFSETEASVHTEKTVYPWALLKEVHDHFNGKMSLDVIRQNGYITFISKPEIRWTMHDIVSAYEYFTIAKANKFTFYPIYDLKGTIGLYVSSIFKDHRVLVDAFTMRQVIVGKPILVKRLSTMIDGKFDLDYLLNLFTYASELEKGHKNFFDGWLSDLGTDEECFNVNPVTAMYPENGTWYGTDEMVEIEQIVKGETKETETFILQGGMVDDKTRKKFKPMSLDWCRYIVDLYRKVDSKRGSFITVYDEDSLEPLMYISTDLRHAIHYGTGEHVNIRNKSLRSLVQNCILNEFITREQFSLLWKVLRLRDIE